MARTALLLLLKSQSKQLISRNIHSTYPYRFATQSVTQYAKPNLNYAATIFDVQKRWASQAKTTEDDSKISISPQKGRTDDGDEKDAKVVYYGPISSTIKKVKMLSLSTCCLSVSLGPVITFMTSPDMNVILKGAVASFVIFLSTTTTAALHWFVSPYIHKIRWQPGSDSFEVEMMSCYQHMSHEPSKSPTSVHLRPTGHL
ncbi:DNA-binding bromodomain-containing family protein [Hibiscus syriacus]|uniref:DNA-binding bromodomain-containing family protein n=1 Tax=Hibiscus syriacus TaxID=106335 RepID=A0A6A3BCR9_HIBSY|nr:DNA-binding bromodomain-containing family protein [Hibiscus syriacus]